MKPKKTKRLFCAIHVRLPDGAKEMIGEFRETLTGERIRWVDPASIHLTLKFFGDTTESRQTLIAEALGAAAGKSARFSFYLHGCGSFGTPREPRVLWIGAREITGLTRLYGEVNDSLMPLGYQPDRQTFVPHLTFARIKEIKNHTPLNTLLDTYSNTVFGACRIESFFLYESILRPEGPVYKTVNRWELGA